MAHPAAPLRRLLPPLLLLALWLLPACQTPSPVETSPTPSPATLAATPVAPPIAVATATVQATATPRLNASPTATNLLAETTALLAPFLTSGENLALIPFAGETTRWAAYTVGEAGLAGHRLWLVGQGPAGLLVLAEQSLTPFSFLQPEQLRMVPVSPSGLWLELSGLAAAGGENCYQLFHVQADAIIPSLTHCHPLLASNGLTDLNGDGVADLVLNESALLCPGCGLSQPSFRVLTWTGDGWAEITLHTSLDSADAELQAANQQMVALATAGFWAAAAERAALINRTNPTVAWNAILIETHVAALRAHLTGGTIAQQFLATLLLGDYEATAGLLRPYPPAALFQAQPEIFAALTPAQLDALRAAIVAQTDQALAADAELAAAHFLRGWALYLADSANPAALQALEQADRLAPTDALFADTLFYFYNHLNYSQ